VVIKCGKKVDQLKPGDRVSIEPGVPCARCDYCREGRYNLCPDVVFCSVPPFHGVLCRYVAHDAAFCFKLPDHVTLEEGVLLEPLSVGVHACRRVGVTLGSVILICGAGPIGLVNLMVARFMGASKIIISDLAENRLQVAKELGADFVLKVDPSKSGEDLAKQIQQALGVMPDISIECTGAEASIELAILSTRPGGRVASVGCGPSVVQFPILSAAHREVDIIGVCRYANCYPAALALVASGKVDVKKLITHRYKLEESHEAFETAKTGAGGAIKVMISC